MFEKTRLCLVEELAVHGVTPCIILSTRNPWFVCFLLPRYMCNIVQKCPMLSLPVGWRKLAGRETGIITFKSKCHKQLDEHNRCENNIFYFSSSIRSFMWVKSQKNKKKRSKINLTTNLKNYSCFFLHFSTNNFPPVTFFVLIRFV